MNFCSNKGTLQISEAVISGISSQAAAETSNVTLPIRHGKPSAPVKIRLSNGTAEIEITIGVLRGAKVVRTAERVQRAVKTAVQSMSGVTVSKVNVLVTGFDVPARSVL
ncbi:MAG: Asp23/Gls24 family envelope stress response protein [Oscillospiraceae bacterium]|jgi:uncharacterized alkaline shock family protein YloU|nr:Asp23/Gls24 family envelope stress response protein [Oscillospiraceae bacterium]